MASTNLYQQKLSTILTSLILIQKIISCIKKNEVPVISGFQGINEDDRITTLGRGGSDTSAVALAAKLKAIRCDIYTDVDGVYTGDPRIVLECKKNEFY